MMKEKQFLALANAGQPVTITEKLYITNSGVSLKINGGELSTTFDNREQACKFGRDNGLNPHEWEAAYISQPDES